MNGGSSDEFMRWAWKRYCGLFLNCRPRTQTFGFGERGLLGLVAVAMQFHIDELPVYFPYPYIYPEQYQYMVHLKRLLDKRGTGLLEVIWVAYVMRLGVVE